MSRPPAFDEAYPRELWQAERRFLEARRGAAVDGDRPPDDAIGVALSGGGIRSATFCLGVFQAFARLDLLRRIDYLSTVSGGGYFGSFLGRLFTRPEVRNAAEVRALLDPEAPRSEKPAGIPDVIDWLRENGRYLSPNGAGDMLLAGAILLRNWATIHVVLLSFVLLVFLSAQFPRLALEASAVGLPKLRALVGCAQGCGSNLIWWSPWVYAAGAMLALWALPLGWAYWLVGRWKQRPMIEWPVCGLAAAVLVSIAAAIASGWLPVSRPRALFNGALLVLGLVLLTAVSWFAAWASAGRSVKSDSRTAPESPGPPVFEIDEQRNLLSRWLATALVATGAVLAFAVLDSIGQTFYLVAMQPGRRLFASLFAALSGLAGVAAFAKPIAIAVAGRPDGRRIGLPMAALAWVAALAIMGVLLIAVSVLTHAITWSFRAPVGAPSLSWVLAAPDLADPRCQPEAAPCPRPGRAVVTTAAVWAVAMLFGWLFGRSWPFLNQSSLQSTYSARLTRAYLGASNPLRRIFGNVTRVKPGDNIDAADYWALPSLPGGDPKARPLHFINVTVNETVDGQSQVQQQDRKGTGLAIGPCSFSLGVRHHAVFPEHRALAPERGQQAVAPRVYPAPDVTAAPGVVAPFRVFSNADSGEWRSGEPLPVGTWTGISGAAFSTGMGARTSLGLSLLCGFGNLRLGYWWDSRVTRAGQAPGGAVFSWLERLFPVQAYLLSEFLSRFYGTSRARWYLSDGGHFENMGGYELIRRRLARILIIDAEADPEYTFDGLANLVRKARLDFGAEITFLTAAELTDLVPGPYRALFGGLEELRRGKWTEEPVRVVRTGRKRQSIEDPIDLTRASLAHAALARVRYLDERSRECWLLYLKPTLIGDEPADLAQYHRSHPSFPQETTGDQFFDEAQWESYRMLGYHIATGVFGARLTTAGAGSGLSGTPPSPSQLLFGP